MLATGEGGFVSTNDTDQAKRLRAFISLGFDGNGYGNQFGVNFKLSGYQAIADQHSLTGLDNYLSSREALCSVWLESLSLLPQLKSLQVADNGK
ncbi:DegT/DnrJ/EryC1/StrS family aminotransferase [Pantoea agglomerans]|uniref:DegT/DnrJ/EryC1/StrS family aminotransferase n=1 Tax=Enterobacter agglomerans TaxID=549 RepID=UPI000E210A16